MKRKPLYIALICWSFVWPLSAQIDLLLSNSNQNAHLFNPALIENNQKINANMLIRRQWIGFPDAPSLEQIQLSSFFEAHKMGLKLLAQNTTTGNDLTRRINLAYAYQVYFSDHIQLNFGLAAGLYQRQIAFSKLVFADGSEPLSKTDETYFRPDFDFGMHLFVGRFELGYAVNHIGNIGRELVLSVVPPHQHWYMGHTAQIDQSFGLTTLLSVHKQGNIHHVQADIQFLFEHFEAGLGWRYKDAIILKAGIKINESVAVFYSYDMGIGRLSNFNTGSHELILQISFERYNRLHLSPRFLD